MNDLRLWDFNPDHYIKTDHRLIFWFQEDYTNNIPSLLSESLKPQGFLGQIHEQGMVTGTKGIEVHYGLGSKQSFEPHLLRSLGDRLKSAHYEVIFPDELILDDIFIYTEIGFYKDERFHNGKKRNLSLWTSKSVSKEVMAAISAHHLVSDLISSPANHLGPQEFAKTALKIAHSEGADAKIITAAEGLRKIAPAIYAVGAAAADDRQPLVFEMRWRSPKPRFKLAIVGKGICFDTGGLNLKTGTGMSLMKKDMGGAAHALALSQWIMQTGLEIDLHLVLALAENSISGAAMRPGDVIDSAKGYTIEIGNTDAEGRLVLADALHLTAADQPELTLCYATLTGAARTALGPDIVPFYTNDDMIAHKLTLASRSQNDPLWRMPLWDGYEDALESDIADLKNDPSSWAQAGSIMAALFLRRFAPSGSSFVHFDLYGWNPRQKPGSRIGPQVQTLTGFL